jgi:cobalt transporter subunit CbtA
MEVFRRLVFAALCAGALSGIVVAAAHQLTTVPLILAAETYEQQAAAQPSADAHSHGSGAASAAAAAEWEPENGVERTLYTLAADLLTAIGFALLLAAGLALRGGTVTWREGLLWGLGGFAAFTLAPGIGLPPEVPGTEAALLLPRQLWWLATVIATGAGLALLAFTRRAFYAATALLLLVLPHLWGAPQPVEHVAAAPPALAHQFVVAVTVASLLFWGILGASTGYFYCRLGPKAG